MATKMSARLNASVENRIHVGVFFAGNEYACSRHVYCVCPVHGHQCFTPRFASTCVWSYVWCSHLRFCVFKDGAGQGKWTKETAERTATANQTTASVSGSIRTGEGRAGRGILAVKQAAGTHHPCMPPKRRMLPAEQDAWLVTMRNFQKERHETWICGQLQVGTL